MPSTRPRSRPAAPTTAGPGVREIYHPDYYGAFVLDPDGNNIEAIYHTRHTDNRTPQAGHPYRWLRPRLEAARACFRPLAFTDHVKGRVIVPDNSD